MLEARETVRNRRVLDLFAGTGALGIEALSRGAASAVCVERSARQCAAIRENAERAGVADRLDVISMPVSRAITTLNGQFGLIFMDPPYEDTDAIPATIDALLSAPNLLSSAAVLVAEQPSRSPANLENVALEEIATRRYGDTMVSLLMKESAGTELSREGLS